MNDACGSEIAVLASSQLEGENPRCSCGSVRKKHYDKSTLRSHDDTGALDRIAENKSAKEKIALPQTIAEHNRGYVRGQQTKISLGTHWASTCSSLWFRRQHRGD
jgi:hypothetical protein